MVRVSGSQDLNTILGRDFAFNRIDAVVAAMLELPAPAAAHVAQKFLESQPERLPVILACLFSQCDVETSHRVLCESRSPWTGRLQLEVRELLTRDLQGDSALPCGDMRQSRPESIALFERYVFGGYSALQRDPVVLPVTEEEKFMLLEIGGELYFRAGGRFHRDIVAKTIKEFLDSGLLKSAYTVAPMGGGKVSPLHGGVCIFGESTDYGKPDFPRVKALLVENIPNLEVRIL